MDTHFQTLDWFHYGKLLFIPAYTPYELKAFIGNGFPDVQILFPGSFYHIGKSSPGMRPASGDCQVLPFICNKMVYLVTIRHTDPAEVFQELPGMFLFPGLLVFIKDNWVGLQFTGTINPHPALNSCRTAIFAYLYHSFIRVYHMMIRQFLLHTVVYTVQVPLRAHDYPAAQSLRWKKYFAALKLFGEAFNRLRIHILQVINTGHKGCRSQTVPKQVSWTFRACKDSAVRTYIYFHVMFDYLEACRMEFQTFIYIVWMLFVSDIRKCAKQFFFRQGMGNHSHRNIFEFFLTSSCFLFSRLYGFRKMSSNSGSGNAGSKFMVISASLKAKQSWLHPSSPMVSPFSEERPKRYWRRFTTSSVRRLTLFWSCSAASESFGLDSVAATSFLISVCLSSLSVRKKGHRFIPPFRFLRDSISEKTGSE